MGRVISICIFLISVAFFASSALWVNSLVSTQRKLENDLATQGAPAINNPLRVLPPGSKPVVTPQPTQSSGFGQNKLTGAKLQACQDISDTFIVRSNNIFKQGLEMEKTLLSLQNGAEQYYLTRTEQSGKTLDLYPGLVADSRIKQQITSSLLESLQSDLKDFSCTGDNPSAQIMQNDINARAIIEALADYKLSVKNMLTGLKTMPEATDSSNIK